MNQKTGAFVYKKRERLPTKNGSVSMQDLKQSAL
jgi:hypothetical protein